MTNETQYASAPPVHTQMNYVQIVFFILGSLILIGFSFLGGYLYRNTSVPQIIPTTIFQPHPQVQVQMYLQSPLLADATFHIRGKVIRINGSNITISDGKNSFTQNIDLNIPINTEVLVKNQIVPVHLSVHDIHINNIVIFSYDYITPGSPALKTVSVVPQ